MGKRVLIGGVALFVLLIAWSITKRALFGSLSSEYPDSPFAFDYSGSSEPPARNHISFRAVRTTTPTEREALLLAYQEKFVLARKQVEAVLRDNRDSIPAHFALALIESRGETNLPYALFVIRETRHRLQRRGYSQPHDLVARDWYAASLHLEHEILEMMDRREEQLRVVELLEQTHGPQPWLKVWPLLKLRRFEEARDNVKFALMAGANDIALNGLAAVEERMQHRQESLEIAKQLTQQFPDKPIFWSNYGLGCYNAFQFDEAERVTLKAATMGPPDFFGTAYRELSMLYVQRGRIAAAIDALKKGQAQRAARPINTLQQDEARMEMTKAMVMLALGHTKVALRFARNADQAPDRAGGTSIDRRDLDFSNSLLLWSVLQTRLEQIREEASGRSHLTSWKPDPEQAAAELELWQLERKLRRELTGDYLVDMIRPQAPGLPGLETCVASWFRGNLVQLLPPAVALEAVHRGRLVKDMAEAVPYLDAMEAEAELRLGRDERTLSQTTATLKTLPAEGEKLLTARVRAIAGEAHLRLGRLEPALQEWDSVLREFPQVLRMLRIRLPIEVQHDNSPLARQMADCLRASPRFHERKGGFLVRVRTNGKRLSFEMFRQLRARHFEGSVAIQSNPDDTVAAGVVALHERLVQPFLDVTQADISSLDGSPAAAQFQGQVDELFRPKKPRK